MAIALAASAIQATANTLAPTVTVNVAATGGIIAVCIGTKAAETISSVTDTIGNTYIASRDDTVGNSPGAAIYYCNNNGTNASNIITVNATTGDWVVSAYVITGTDATPQGNTGGGNGTSTSSSVAITTGTANSVIIVAMANSGGANFSSPGSGQTNFLTTGLGSPDNTDLASSTEFTTTAGSNTQTFSIGKSNTWRGVAVEFKEESVLTTVTHIIDKGGTGDYLTLAAWQTDIADKDLVTRNVIQRALCKNTTGVPDTDTVSITGWTVDATRYVIIEAFDDHNGVWDDNVYNIERSWSSTILNVSTPFTRVIGIQVHNLNTTTAGANVFAANGIGSSGNLKEVYFENCIARGSSGAVGTGYYTSGSYVLPRFKNCLAYGFNGATGKGLRFGIGWTTENALIFNSTVADCTIGFETSSNAVNLTNCLAADVVSGYVGTWHSNSDYNINSANTVVTGANSISGLTPLFVNSGIANYQLSLSDTVAIDAGADLTNHATYPVTLDVAGTTRPSGNAVDIGFFEALQVSSLAHVVDSNFKATKTLEHVVDANLALASKTLEHAVDSSTKFVKTLEHVVDANLALTNSFGYYSDSNLKSTNYLKYITDTNLKSVNTLNYAIDSSFKSSRIYNYSVYSSLTGTLQNYYNVDTVLLNAKTINYTTDTRLKIAPILEYSIDSILGVITSTSDKSHNTDSTFIKTEFLTGSVDSLLGVSVTKSYNIDTSQISKVAVKHNITAPLKKTTITSCSIDTKLYYEKSVYHTFDATLKGPTKTTYNIDSTFNKTYYKNHSIDTRTTYFKDAVHRIKALLLKDDLIINHSIDAIISKSIKNTYNIDSSTYIENSSFIVPNGNVVIALIPSTATNYECVDEYPLYISDSVIASVIGLNSIDSLTDIYELSSLNSKYVYIHSIQLWARAKVAKTKSGSYGSIKAGVSINNINYFPPAQSLTTSWAVKSFSELTLNPSTGESWVEGDIVNLRLALNVKVANGNTSTINTSNVSTTWIIIKWSYKPGFQDMKPLMVV